jgi:arabinose-5-phosphate isomerase
MPADASPQPDSPVDPATLLQLARDVLDTEADAVRQLAPRLGEAFVAACRLLLGCRGRVVVLGMGKSGHIGGKIAATLASTGTPAFFVHPGEASHGDLGMITPQDVVLALSNSGETGEILLILPMIRRLGVRLIAITGHTGSTLAREADVNLDASVAREACPLGLAPTASTTATLALGDALAVALLHTRGFSREDFSRSHPGGKLGRRLLLHVADVMVKGDRLPAVPQTASLTEALLEISRKGLGMTAVVDDAGRAVGIFTDGDLRRVLERVDSVRAVPIADVMTPGGVRIRPQVLAAEAAQIMEQRRINALLVEDADGRLVGALNMHTLLDAGVI